MKKNKATRFRQKKIRKGKIQKKEEEEEKESGSVEEETSVA